MRAFVVVALAAALAAFLLTRPASASLTAQPSGSRITLSGGGLEEPTSAVDALAVERLEPGGYSITVERRGFKALARTIELRRGRHAEIALRLQPEPIPLEIAVEPGDSACVVETGGRRYSSAGTFDAKIPAGPAVVSVSRGGFNTFKRSLFLDRPTSLDVLLDPEGQVVHKIGVIPCAGAPKAVALTPDGRQAWTTILNGPPSIQIFDPRTGRRIGEIDIGKYGAVEVVFSKDGRRAYASQMETARVFEIDVATRKVLRSMDTESAWSKLVELSPDGATIFVANWSGDDVSELDLATGELRRRVPVADTPRGLCAAADGKTLWVASFGTGALERVDLATGEVDEVFRSEGGALRHLVADQRAARLYSSDMAKDRVFVTDMRTGKTRLFAKVDHKPNTIDLSPDGRVLFVSCRGENNARSYYLPGPEWGSVLLLDTGTGKPLDAIVGGNQCTALDVSADGRLLAFSDFLDDRLRIYEVPGYGTLVAGNGGRYRAHFAELAK